MGTPISRSAALSRSNAARRVLSLPVYWPASSPAISTRISGLDVSSSSASRFVSRSTRSTPAIRALATRSAGASGARGDGGAHDVDDLVAGGAGCEHACDAELHQLGDVRLGDDPTDDDGDLGPPLAHLLDDQRREGHVRAR